MAGADQFGTDMYSDSLAGRSRDFGAGDGGGSTNNVAGKAGGVPSGGGGGSYHGTQGLGGGAGAKGEVRIWAL